MSFKLITTPRVPVAFDAHASDAVSHQYIYHPNAVMEDESIDQLDLRIYKPVGIPNTTALPFVVWCNIGSFSVSPSTDDPEEVGPWGVGNRVMADWFVQCGMICAIVRLPIQQNDPVWSGYTERGAGTELSRRIDAIIEYGIHAYKFVRSNPDPDNWRVEPNWGFHSGGSSGGITAMCGRIRHPYVTPAGQIVVVTSFGANNALLGLDYVDEVRTELGHTEAQLDNTIPLCHFSVLNDTILSEAPPPSYQQMLKDRLDALGTPSITHWDTRVSPPQNGHLFLSQWDEPDSLTGASTIEEAVYNFTQARCAAAAVITDTVQFEPTGGSPPPTEEADIWVPDDYTTIQGAIDAATAGQVIGVRAAGGPYVSNGNNLNKAVTLRTWDGAVIEALTAGNGTGIEILSDNCSVIGNFTLLNFGEGIAVAPDNTVGYDNVTIQGLGHLNGERLVIEGTQFGMWVCGEAWDVRYVEIDRVRRRYSGDIDYTRCFGRDHYFYRCYYHGIDLPDDLAPLSGTDYGHTDCFQFYNQNPDNQRILIDCTWEECIFTEFVQGAFIANEFVAPNCISGLLIRNCVFWGTSFTAVSNLVGMPSHGIFLGKEDAITNVIIDNCTFRLAANVWTLDGIPGSTITIENCIYDGLTNEGTVYSFQSGTPITVLDVGTGNWLYRYSWFGSEGGFGADVTGTDPQLGATLLGASTEPWGADAGWRPAHVPAQSYGPQMAP